MLKNLIVTIVVVITPLPAAASSKIVFRGKPLIHIVVTPDTVTHERVPPGKRDQFMTLITKGDASDTYTWASREDHELFGVPSGSFTYFVAPTTGIIKIGDVGRMRSMFAKMVPMLTDMSEAEAAGVYWGEFHISDTRLREADYAYVEILYQGLGVVMYYGVGDHFDP